MNPEKGLGKRIVKFIDWFGHLWRSHVTENDRNELPFNRADRVTVRHLAARKSDIAAFGSTRDLAVPGTPVFVNCQFPTLERDAVKSSPVTVGPYAKKPYSIASIFNFSAISHGAAGTTYIRTLSQGAKLAGCWLNTGEGGLSPAHLESGCDIVFQIGTAKYGVRDENGNFDLGKLKQLVADHPQVRMIEIKLAQGAKPGKGGILPAVKVNKEIAEIRGIPEGKDSISPNRHVEIGNAAELLDFVRLVRDATGLPTGIKTVLSESDSIDILAAEIKKRGLESAPDFISLDGGDGGTGAAPMALMDNVGLPLRYALPMLSGALNKHGLSDRIPINASGKLVTPIGIAWALCAGASFVSTTRGAMFAAGCVQSLQCNENTCPVGITTNDPRLEARLNPAEKSVKQANYILGAEAEVEVIAHSCGVAEPRQLGPQHVRIIQKDGPPLLLSEMYPDLVRKPAPGPV
jgi:glutamate synthase domain-containing protein 2